MSRDQAMTCSIDLQSVQNLSREVINRNTKGLPLGASVTAAEVKAAGWNVLKGDLPFPLLVLKESALEHNLRTMAEWCERHDMLLAPHGKTTMCPQIFARQIEQGAWAMTVANVTQAAICLRFGITRILIANQVAGSANLSALAALLNHESQPELYCLIDSVDGVRQLAAGLEQFGARRPIKVLIEWGRQDWRTGVRSLQEGMDVFAEAALFSSLLRVSGVEAFEGLASSPDGSDAEARIVDEFLDGLRALGERVRAELDQEELPLLSAGGSAFLDRVARLAQATAGQYRFVVRSGCYATHDHQHYQHLQDAWLSRSKGGAAPPEFIPALEIWGVIQSIPQPGRGLLNFGKRDCSYDLELPTPLLALAEGQPINRAKRLNSAQIANLNDQHAYLDFGPDEQLRVGELIGCGISHPCTSFDKWRVIPVIDDHYTVVDLYHTFF